MSDLTEYQKRRNFARTSEPQGKSAANATADHTAVYVVQKHAARHLHYDFRLELDGVLLSWAVPKGPSLDPSVRRLAVQVEPHPVEYGDFEGQISEGQYGAGAVMVWDRGYWQALDDDPKSALERGHLTFRLTGAKLSGTWHLVHTRGRKPNTQWLLFKSRDEHAEVGEDTILEREPNSVLTGRSIEEIARHAAPDRTKRPRAGVPAAQKGASSRLEANMGSAHVPAPTDRHPLPHPSEVPNVTDAVKRSLPATVQVQLAELTDKAPDGDDWIHEIKFDGYRVLVRIENDEVRLLTRKGLDWTDKMPSLAAAFARLAVGDALFDGEFVALDESGVSDFQLLQNSLSSKDDAALVYYAFDLLHYSGFDLTRVSLLDRKRLLTQVLTEKRRNQPDAVTSRIRVSEHVRGAGQRFFEQACQLGLEGVVSKRAAGLHVQGRSKEWLKIKCTQRQEFVIVGYTDPAGSRANFGALLVAVNDEDELVYCGRVGTGFTARSLQELHAKLEPLEVGAIELANAPKGAHARGVHWVTPSLVAQVAFTGFTQDAVLRHPSFEGLREDKRASEVRRERTTAARADADAQAGAKNNTPRPKVDVSTVKLTNPDKVLFPDRNLTKRHLLDYMALVAPLMLPHVVHRPLTLVRCPNGVDKPCFFQKHPGDAKVPGLYAVGIRENEGKADYTAIQDASGLFALVQLGALEVHTSGAFADNFEHPNLLVFDLDPDPSVAFSAVMECAKRLREIFASANLQSFVKTTGGKGLHVCVPVEPTLSWNEAKAFTQRIAQALVKEAPERYVATQSKAQRSGKIFIDYLRNGRGATFVAPYSTRARGIAPVATPLFWEELTPDLTPAKFTLENLPERLSEIGQCPFAAMTDLHQELPGTRRT